MTSDWSAVFRRSTVHPAVFAVRDPERSEQLLQWARTHDLAHDHRSYLLAAELEGWAFLDGGLSYLRSHARGRLRSGLRVIGWLALRHAAGELGVAPPQRILTGEVRRPPPDRVPELLDQGWVRLGSPQRQAALLVSYVDAPGLREVADALLGSRPEDGPEPR